MINIRSLYKTWKIAESPDKFKVVQLAEEGNGDLRSQFESNLMHLMELKFDLLQHQVMTFADVNTCKKIL